ncbi:MAG: hypothetical protein RL260_1714 [Pseudomonadota bacterium]
MTHYHEEALHLPDHPGWVFRVRHYVDDVHGYPWGEMTMLGEVREVRANRYSYHNHATGKRPGERVLDWTNSAGWAYDWLGAVKEARRHGASGPDAVKAANHEFEYLRRYLTGQWHWMGVAVTATKCPPELDAVRAKLDEFDHALWGCESDAHDYTKEVAEELACDLVRSAKAARAASKACPHCGAVSNPAGWCHVGTLGYLPDGRAIRQESGALGPSINSGETE